MPKTNITLDNTSPLISYQPPESWAEGDRNASGDPFALRYSNNGTVTFTSSPGAAASLTFHGTGVWIFGAKRSNHGPYNITLDDSVSLADGFASNPELFQTVLFQAASLSYGKHTVTIRNNPNDTDASFLDIDYVIFETETASGSDGPLTLRVDCTSSSFSFSPESSWKVLKYQEDSQEASQTACVTTEADASMTLAFTGSTVSLYGVVGPNSGSYSVQVDDLQSTNATFNATTREYTPNTLLYHATDLASGNHTLRVINQPKKPGQELLIDHAIVGTTFTSRASALTSNPKVDVALVVILTLVGVVIFGGFVGLILYFRRRQAQKWR